MCKNIKHTFIFHGYGSTFLFRENSTHLTFQPLMISLIVCLMLAGSGTPLTMPWRVLPLLKRNPGPELEPELVSESESELELKVGFLLVFLLHSEVAVGQKTKSLGTPSWPGLQETPDLTFLHSSPCSVTQVPVLLCSASTLESYFTRQPRPPAHVPASLAKPPQVSPY